MKKIKTATATEIGINLTHKKATLAFIKKNDPDLYERIKQEKKKK